MYNTLHHISQPAIRYGATNITREVRCGHQGGESGRDVRGKDRSVFVAGAPDEGHAIRGAQVSKATRGDWDNMNIVEIIAHHRIVGERAFYPYLGDILKLKSAGLPVTDIYLHVVKAAGVDEKNQPRLKASDRALRRLLDRIKTEGATKVFEAVDAEMQMAREAAEFAARFSAANIFEMTSRKEAAPPSGSTAPYTSECAPNLASSGQTTESVDVPRATGDTGDTGDTGRTFREIQDAAARAGKTPNPYKQATEQR
jgi:hypothetical protein